MCRHKRNDGWILTEAAVVMAVMSVIFMVMLSAAATCRKLNRLLLVRQQCLSAARAQIDSVIATGEPINAEAVERLWPGLSVSVDIRDGRGEWQGLTCCVATATAKFHSRDIEMRLCRYYLPTREPDDGQR